MPVRIRLSRGGAKKRPYYRIVVADSRRSRDGKFIAQVGTYNPMLNKDNPERIKIDLEKAKEWISKGAQPSDRVKLFLSTMGIGEKPVITEKTKKHLPKKKAQEKLAALKAAAEAPAAEAPAAEAPAAEAPAAEAQRQQKHRQQKHRQQKHRQQKHRQQKHQQQKHRQQKHRQQM